MRQNIGTRSPPSRPEWWLFYSSDRRHGHLCLGQTAAVAARKARRRFGVHWSQLDLEYLGENPVVEPTWTVDEDDLYTYRVRRAREQFLREATEAQLRRHHLLERLRRADGDLRASRERMFLMHQLQVLADNTERIGNEFRRCREALRPFAKIGLANSRQRPAQQHFVHASIGLANSRQRPAQQHFVHASRVLQELRRKTMKLSEEIRHEANEETCDQADVLADRVAALERDLAAERERSAGLLRSK